MCRDGIPPKNCAAVIILALSYPGAKRKYFLTSAQGLLRNVTLQFHSRGWITIPGFLDHYPRVSKKEKMEFDRFVLSPPPSPSIGVGMLLYILHIQYQYQLNMSFVSLLLPVFTSLCSSTLLPGVECAAARREIELYKCFNFMTCLVCL